MPPGLAGCAPRTGWTPALAFDADLASTLRPDGRNDYTAAHESHPSARSRACCCARARARADVPPMPARCARPGIAQTNRDRTGGARMPAATSQRRGAAATGRSSVPHAATYSNRRHPPRRRRPRRSAAPQTTATQAEQDYDAIYGAGIQRGRRFHPARTGAAARQPTTRGRSSTARCTASTTWSTAISPSRSRRPTSPWCRARCAWAWAISSPTSASRSARSTRCCRASRSRRRQALGRFVLNATLGLGGIFDPATDAQHARTAARTSARPSACGAGSVRATSNCRCSGRAPCATCSAWSAMRRWRRCAASRTTRSASSCRACSWSTCARS